MNTDKVCREIIEALMQLPQPTLDDINRLKISIADKYSLNSIPANSQIIKCLQPKEELKLLPLLRRKVIRTISGVTIIAVMTKPYPCPQPQPCAYCPGGPSKGTPQSYTGHEPAAMRGIQNQYDPYKQVRSRIDQLKAIGHVVDKIELIVMGGTFPATPKEYQEYFIKECLDAITETKTTTLEEAKKTAENSKIRNVGITVETRPDWARQQHVDHMLSLGVTRVELGVQNIYDDIYQHVGRKHTVKDAKDATRILKDSGIKIVYHLMPGLPGSNFERDLEAFKTIFSNPDYKPDMLKIYPCIVIKGTQIYKWWKKGEYKPYTTEEAVKLIAEVKKIIPRWIRIMRVQRDIPAPHIEAGVKHSNLRQLVLQRLKGEGKRCHCIRCREVGHRWLIDKVKPDPEKLNIIIHKEEASEGEDIFISAEDPTNDVLIGYLRLRIPSEKAHRPEINSQPTGIVRELHVYGMLVPVGKRDPTGWQHKGYGESLLSTAERIAQEEYGCRKMIVTSALGTKQYYMQHGYKYDGPYMSKMLER